MVVLEMLGQGGDNRSGEVVADLAGVGHRVFPLAEHPVELFDGVH